MNHLDALAAKCHQEERRLQSWHKRLGNPRYFQPVIKCEWDYAFDARERAKLALCRTSPERFALEFPNEPNDRHL